MVRQVATGRRARGILLMVVLSAILPGCLGAPELIELRYPDVIYRGIPEGISWTFEDPDEITVSHAEVHWSVDDRVLDKRMPAERIGDGPYRECGDVTSDCDVGSFWVSWINGTETGEVVYFQVHTVVDGFHLRSGIEMARLEVHPWS